MKPLYLVLFFSIFVTMNLWAQPSNDLCSDAIELTDLNNDCSFHEFANATFDVRNGSCGPAFSRNVWFYFTAQGTDVDIEINTNNGPEAYITLYEFLPPTCNATSAFELGCDTNELAIQNITAIGGTYYINVAFPVNYMQAYTICINNPEINLNPLNDYKCFPQPVSFDDQCVMGTTDSATFDENNPVCAFADVRSVWYSGRLSSGKNQLDVTLTNLGDDSEVAVMIGQYPNNNCVEDFNFLSGDCFDSVGSVSFTNLIPGELYYLMVSHEEENGQEFEICFDEIGPPEGCAVNNQCDIAELIEPESGGSEVCVTGCNRFASFGPILFPGTCYNMETPTVWYHLRTDEVAGVLDFEMTSDTLRFPHVAFYSSCDDFDTVFCEIGNDKQLQFFRRLLPNADYWIAVTDISGRQGNFDLCMRVEPNFGTCTVEDTLYAINTSFGSPLEGPYQTGELVTFRYELTNWNKNNCNKLSGIVPFFGPGWDPGFFGDDRAPRILENPDAVSPGFWDWYPAGTVRYNYNNPNKGFLRGAPLGAGWYFVNNNTPNDDPNASIGDGFGCTNDTSDTWSVTFVLRAFDGEDCPLGLEIPANVGVRTFGDGEIGAGLYQGCAFDQPEQVRPSVSCCEGPDISVSPTFRRICSFNSATIDFSSFNDVDEVYWVVSNEQGILPADDGSGLLFSQQIFLLPGVDFGTVTFTFYPRDTTGCVGSPIEVTWDVYPEMIADAGIDRTSCEGSVVTLGGDPTALGGFGQNYQFVWTNGLARVPNPQITVTEGRTVYTVFISDATGCTDMDSVVVNGIPVPTLMIEPIANACSGRSGNIDIQFDGTPPFNWTIEAGDFLNESFQNYNDVSYSTTFNTDEDFEIVVNLIEDNNCPANDEYNLSVQVDPPRTSNISATICFDEVFEAGGQTFDRTGDYDIFLEGGATDGCDSLINLDLDVLSEIVVQTEDVFFDAGSGLGYISLTIAGGLPPYSFEWSNGGPDLDSIGDLEAGTYSVIVTDQIGCQNEFEFMVGPNSDQRAVDLNWQAYPNPLTIGQLLNVRINEEQFSARQFRWVNTLGQSFDARVERVNDKQFLIHSPNQTGTYLLKAIDEKGRVTKSIQIIVAQ